jgi:hypothetical protein
MTQRFFSGSKLILAFVICLSTISCNDSKNTGVLIQGRIVNPYQPYLVLTDYVNLKDTLYLDNTGQFKVKYENLSPGFYSIIHPAEYQSIYLAHGDSLKLRLNTKAFDETLAFSGKGSRENNYLINEFLEIEKEGKKLVQKAKLEPNTFLEYVDSLSRERKIRLKKKTKANGFSKDFVRHMQKGYDLNRWSMLERYAIAHYGKNKFGQSIALPEVYYEHRSKIDLNDAKLLNNFAFRSFIKALIDNKTLQVISETDSDLKNLSMESPYYTKVKMQTLWSTVGSSEIRNSIALGEIKNFIRTRKNATEIYDFIAEFTQLSDDEVLNKTVTEFASTFISLERGNTLPNLTATSYEGSRIEFNSIANGPTVLFFWSNLNQEYNVMVHNEVQELRLKYPEITFLGINIDETSLSEWRIDVKRFGYDTDYEYQLTNPITAKSSLALKASGRTIMVDKNLKIIDSDLNLFHYQIETTLLGYLNQ